MGYDFWKGYANKKIEKPLPRVNCDLSDDLLNKYIKKAYIEFYFRPLFILKTLFRAKSFKQIYNYGKAGLAMLKN